MVRWREWWSGTGWSAPTWRLGPSAWVRSRARMRPRGEPLTLPSPLRGEGGAAAELVDIDVLDAQVGGPPRRPAHPPPAPGHREAAAAEGTPQLALDHPARIGQQCDAARPEGPHQRDADGRPLQVVVDHVAADDQVVGVRLAPVAAVVPVAADGAGRGQAVAQSVAPGRGEGSRLAVEDGDARA